MDSLLWLRQGALFAHAMAFAIALAAVLREDWALLTTGRIHMQRLAATARTLTAALAALWATGLSLVLLQLAAEPPAAVWTPKLVAKLLVVVALTANGLALHRWVLPRLTAPHALRTAGAWPVVLGAVSTASWLAASFIGLSRVVSPMLTLADYLLLYAALLAAAVAVALRVVRPRWARSVAVS